MTSIRIWLSAIPSRGAWLLPLAAAWLLASPAGAFPVLFDGPAGYGISSESAAAAFGAGFTRLTPAELHTAEAFGLAFPDPLVLGAALNDSPSVTNPITVTSLWTVRNGARALQDAWLVFLRPQTYDPPRIGIDLQTGQWGIVEVSVGSGESSTEYFYPAVRLGTLAAGGSAQFQMHHVVGMPLIRQGNSLVLPRYGVGIVGRVPVPEPAALALLGILFAGLLLRRRSAA